MSGLQKKSTRQVWMATDMLKVWGGVGVEFAWIRMVADPDGATCSASVHI